MGAVGPSRWVEVESGVSLGVLTHPHLNSDPQDPKERLGCRPQTGFSDIKSHAFFRSIDWDLLEKKQTLPPFQPQITDDYGLDNFDTQFTSEPVQLTPDDE